VLLFLDFVFEPNSKGLLLAAIVGEPRMFEFLLSQSRLAK
jgi:hypothetical protein